MILNFKEYVRKHYENARDNQGYSGGQHDGGYRVAMAIMQAHNAGETGQDLKKVTAFIHLIGDFEAQKDPEYDEFLRLQKKFSNQ
jgi:hypothetical protein